MLGLEEHASYILGAYAGVAIVTIGAIVLTLLANRQARARITALEDQGVRRRSSKPGQS